MERRSSGRRAVILLAEDDYGDQELTKRALQDELLNTDLRIVDNGEQAMEYLKRQGKYVDPDSSPRPDLLLLDLNMPLKNGREVMVEMKSDPQLCNIPVVVLTTSKQDRDVLSSYQEGCNSFIQKPVDIDQFIQVVQQLGKYWFEMVTLPTDVAV